MQRVIGMMAIAAIPFSGITFGSANLAASAAAFHTKRIDPLSLREGCIPVDFFLPGMNRTFVPVHVFVCQIPKSRSYFLRSSNAHYYVKQR
jgi:hypothetical protein